MGILERLLDNILGEKKLMTINLLAYILAKSFSPDPYNEKVQSIIHKLIQLSVKGLK